ncbi:Cyanovirin-N [Apiospora arundinis]|uniref:Cyanovirin-N domain-containing protein n=1 Tax=Apiospora arundinis TaxID=335852 RepID=A0ABR2HT48_9PEZI
MSYARISVLSFLVQLFVRLAVAGTAGFLDEGCHTFDDPWYLNNGVATSSCDTHVCDSNVQTSLNLNLCIGAENGTLVEKRDGYFGFFCKDCEIVDNFRSLQCSCMSSQVPGAVEWQNSTLPINTGFIYNWFGYLSCFNLYQTQIPHTYECKDDPTWQPSPTDLDGCQDWTCLGGTQQDAGNVLGNTNPFAPIPTTTSV